MKQSLLYSHLYDISILITIALHLVSNVQRIIWHLSLNKRLIQPCLSFLPQEFKVRFVTKGMLLERSMAGSVYSNITYLAGYSGFISHKGY